MSHNKIKIGTAQPNVNSELNVNIADLSNVNLSTPTVNQYLTYDGSNFVNTTPATNAGLIFAGEGASQNYSGSGASGVAVSDVIEFYASSPTNTIGSATITSSSNWISSITLPAGTYRLTAVAGLELSLSSGLLEYRWHDGSAEIGTTGNCGYDNDRVGNPATSVVTPSTSTTYSIRIITATDITALASQTTRHAQRGYLIIEKV